MITNKLFHNQNVFIIYYYFLYEDSSNQSSSSGTLKKEGRSKNRRKWTGLLSGAVKSKTLNRNGDVSVEDYNKRHSTGPRLPIPSIISKDTMVRILYLFSVYYLFIFLQYNKRNIFFNIIILVPNFRT